MASFKTSLAYDLKRQPTTSELQQVMNAFDPVQLPVLSTLAKNFVLCDRWFADVPGPTMPNRAYVHAATSQGYTYNADWKPKFTCKTLYDRINADQSRSWRSYYHDQDDILELYPYLEKNETNHVQFEGNFVSDVAGDKLATYSFITPAFLEFAAASHQQHACARRRAAGREAGRGRLRGLAFAAQCLQEDPADRPVRRTWRLFRPRAAAGDGIARRHRRDRWTKSFLVPFDFKRLGLRVPAILISPWFQPAVDSTVYSHSTIPGSIIDALQLPGGFLTKRDANANKLTAKYLDQRRQPHLAHRYARRRAPVQPQPLDPMAREVLNGTVHLDPHPDQRNPLRTQDIQDPAQAKQFMKTQIAKHLEHYFASKGKPKAAANSRPRTNRIDLVSPSRIAELKATPKEGRKKERRP